ncbi:hypothetical protein [Halospeciosus flavus]|uniref:DUF7981 domain-containing protein n=1 Tax=Halospeciosus flavus TaxID=3032283 RepID=A0ABD5Z7X8_9EURY|nr:hypothetical protein [Halospeciosus flavus]
MDARTRDALAWGLVGVFAFLVLALGYRLFGGRLVPWPAVLAVALAVGGIVTGVAHAAAKRRV